MSFIGDKFLPREPYEALWGVEVDIHSFLISALDKYDLSGLRLGRFTPGINNTQQPLNKESGWVSEPDWAL
jgi:hypothetical protein